MLSVEHVDGQRCLSNIKHGLIFIIVSGPLIPRWLWHVR